MNQLNNWLGNVNQLLDYGYFQVEQYGEDYLLEKKYF